MKAIKYILLLIIIALGVAPFGVSYIVEQKYSERVAQLNSMYAGEVKVEYAYTRGYFTSTAQTSITNVAQNQTLTVTDTIHNGPVIFDFKGWGNPSSYIPQAFKLAVIDTKITGDFAEAINSVYGGKEAYSIKTTIEYNGSGMANIEVMPVTIAMGQASIEWQGARLALDFNESFTKYSGEFTAPMLTYTDGLNSFRVAQIQAEFMNNLETFANSFDFNISVISLAEETTTVLEIKKIEIKGMGARKDQLLDGTLDYSVDQMRIRDQDYGPITLAVTVKNIDPTLANQVANESNGSEQSNQNLVKLLANQPMMTLVLNALTPNGAVQVNSNGSVGGATLSSAEPEAILQTLDVTVDLKIAMQIVNILLEKFVDNEVTTKQAMYFMQNADNANAAPNPYTMSAEELQEFTATWIKGFNEYLITNNFAVQDAENYNSSIKYQANVLTVNGKEMQESDINALTEKFSVNLAPVQQPAAVVEPTTPDSNMQQTPDPMQPLIEEEQQRQEIKAVPATPAPAV